MDPNLSSWQAIRKAKKNNPLEDSPPLQLLTHHYGSAADPYQFVSQVEATKINFIKEKRQAKGTAKTQEDDQENNTLSKSQPTSDSKSHSTVSQSLFTSPSLHVQSTSATAQVSSPSPSAVVPASLITELKRQAGVSGHDGYQLKLVKVVRTIVEERHVFSELVQDGRIVRGSKRSWIVSRN